MREALFGELDLAAPLRLLREAVGVPLPCAVRDVEGRVAFSSDTGEDGPVARLLAELSARGFEWEEGDPLRREELAGGRALLVAGIDGHVGCAGWLVCLVDEEDARGRHRRAERLAELLPAAARCISDAYRLAGELSGLAQDLSDRYEELNLVYSLEGHREAFARGDAGVRTLLGTFAEHLDVDLVALVLEGRRFPLFAGRPAPPIKNLDLLLTELRGNLFRFVQSSRTAMTLNATSDERRRYLFTYLPYKVLACPIASADAVDGMLVLLRHVDKPDFRASDRSLAEVISGQTAILMRNHAMWMRLERFGRQMAAALIEVVEAKDPYTRGHSERVQNISVHLGRALEMRPGALDGLYWGALLHDIGKIAVPDVILCKPDRLSDDEYTFIKIHPERSYEIMRHIESLSREALDGARYHQERYDGRGYPHGLKGDDIPYHARVIAVADTYDAITSSRAYRPGESHEVAIAEIRRVAGTQLDPTIVRAFDAACSEDVGWLLEITQRGEHAHD